ncbi:MAG: methylcrotonoyl-CoA carboxylase [Sphingobacteriia bacterium 24-36-13]|jgi:acetyl-CoA carboxylase carboxyltransferase component|uniref:acyl-CoA carboxylase subunit beta n=1 Tax=Sediminibacterium sp. TaxID=1917865 RepID=UPI000BC7C41D|nr:carboxyl transferase domain-containing protein [Sediminibacterium sp.]OYY09965.1 MAG: methylcrotonoyl-CoA carboxylase [Sphingobacteriia bacterium 35-36-14]OYZ55538.1 MAG: methylcrotonoyl-CoA carboxylase [Sphingobacteriia bacterium 24-36-13]OZA66005.1 MAG: methylcrotonoyl-CoA carboxylase [Sphingobacteriia bacterium 39-36-14]MBT9484815.1 acyl-CoA carboxylase subunit beta [Sediminibacterium sp.]HQS23497.1 carboxyl transferase domain-containing protein [Sediminibacterium sp.]
MNLNENRNEDWMKLMLSEMRQRMEKIALGGGKKAIEKQKERNKLTARERIEYLCDSAQPFTEIGGFAGYGMYEDEGGCPAGGTVAGIGYISGRQCVIVANDQTVKAGAWFPITGKKNLRMQEIAMENRLPIIYLVDSAGVFLPMQDEIFPDKEHFGRVFRNNARMSAMGITQIAAVMGACVAGGAYLPIMSDETLMVEGNGSIFLAGSYLVKAAIGEDIDNETLGGAITHTEISGIADYKFKTEHDCLDHIKKIISKIGAPEKAGFDRVNPAPPVKNPSDIYSIIPEGNLKPYDMLEIIERMVDNSEFNQFKQDYGKTILCGYARIEGWAVGIVANQRLVCKSKKGEMQIGGVIYNDSADKAARFIMNCNQKKIPLVFLQDVTGFMVGSRSEHSGIIKDGAKLVNAVANSIVPKITIVIGNSYGAGNYAMCGKAYDPRFIFAWPSAKIAVMGGDQAAKTLAQIQVATMKSKGREVTPEEEKTLLDTIKDRYYQQTTPYYAAARLWVDEIIDPINTRQLIAESIAASNHNPYLEKFNTGVFQV